MKRQLPVVGCVVLLASSPAWSAVVVNDSWVDGGRNNGADATDTDWWSSTSSGAIEVGTGFLGLVTGNGGRGIHGTFPAQTLSVGDSLRATFTFTTPATVSTAGTASGSFKIGLFDTTGKPGLAANISSTGGSGSTLYNNLAGYMLDYDVNTATADIALRERTNATSGQLMATAGDYTALGNGGTVGYTFAANTSYTGEFTIERTATGLTLTGSLLQGTTLLSSHSRSDSSMSTDTYGMLGFHVNSNVFGSSGTVNTVDNGIDFTNVTIEYFAALPEPTALALIATLPLMALRRKRA